VTNEAGSQRITASTRRSTGTAKDHVQDLFPVEFLPVVEALEVQELAQQLNRRRGSVGVQLGHIHVVNKHDHRLAHWSTQLGLLALLQRPLDHLLGAAAARLGGEVEDHRDDTALGQAFHATDGQNRFAHSRVSGYHHGHAPFEQKIRDIAGGDRERRRSSTAYWRRENAYPYLVVSTVGTCMS